MMPGGIEHARRHPAACAAWLTSTLGPDGITVSVAHHDAALTVFDVRLDAPPPKDLPGYPAEQVRVNVGRTGEVWAVPVRGDERAWCHRYPYLTTQQIVSQPRQRLTWIGITGPLCLEYPRDPPHLRWHWTERLHTYMRIVQRHLWSEEYWRRHGAWPVEDAPHGDAADGTIHLIRTLELRSA